MPRCVGLVSALTDIRLLDDRLVVRGSISAELIFMIGTAYCARMPVSEMTGNCSRCRTDVSENQSAIGNFITLRDTGQKVFTTLRYYRMREIVLLEKNFYPREIVSRGLAAPVNCSFCFASTLDPRVTRAVTLGHALRWPTRKGKHRLVSLSGTPR
jgi:hypothetical protein